MNITVQRYIDIRMPKDLAETFYVKSQLHTSRCKRVTERMEIRVRYPAFPYDGLKTVLHGPWLHIAVFLPCKEKAGIRLPAFNDQAENLIRQRYASDGTAAFRR